MFEPKPYTPLVHCHLRYYLRFPYKTEFEVSKDKKKHDAVKNALSDLTATEYCLLKSIVEKPDRPYDIKDSYIDRRLHERGMSNQEIRNFYSLLIKVDAKIAETLEYNF